MALFVRVKRDGVCAPVSGGWGKDNPDAELEARYELRRLEKSNNDERLSFEVVDLPYAVQIERTVAQHGLPPNEIVDWAETEAEAKKIAARFSGFAEPGDIYTVINA